MTRVLLNFDGETMPVDIVDAGPEHLPFVINSWLTSYREADEPRKMGNDVFFRNHHRLVTELVQRDGVRCLIGVLPDDPSVFIGWACAEPKERVFHYAFTKPPFRDAGLLRQLLTVFGLAGGWGTDDEIALTHHTYMIDKMRKRSMRWRRQFVYNPYRRTA